MLSVNNLAVLVCAAMLWMCLVFGSGGGPAFVGFLCLAIGFSAVSNAAIRGKKIVYTKDWVMILVVHEQGAVLSGN